jgi:hypothetical protein
MVDQTWFVIAGSWWASQVTIFTVPPIWPVTRTWAGICFQSTVNVFANSSSSSTQCCTRHVSINNLSVSYSGKSFIYFLLLLLLLAAHLSVLTFIDHVVLYCSDVSTVQLA